MKNLITLVIALLAATVLLQAQPNNKPKKPKMTPEQRAEKMTQRMKDSLSLTADQVAKLQPLNMQKVKDIKAIKDKYANQKDKTAMKTEIKAVKDDWHLQIKNILTADQYTKFQQMRQRAKNQRDKKMKEKKFTEEDAEDEDFE